MLVWHKIVNYLGKVRSWQIYSLIFICTYSSFIFLDDTTELSTLVILAVANALPNGAFYLNDVILTDVIDYDEFLTGSRSEGIYTVFSSYIPKIVGIFAQAIPLSVLFLAGYVQSTDGQIAEQPAQVVLVMKLVF